MTLRPVGFSVLVVFVAVIAVTPWNVEPTLSAYTGIVVATCVIAIRNRCANAFAVAFDDLRWIGIALAAFGVGMALQVLLPFCIGACLTMRSTTIDTPSLILALILAPIAESVVFQGWFYEAGYFLFGRHYAIALSIGGFFLIHGTVSWYLLAAAIALIALRLRTHSLGPVVLCHAIVNGFITAAYLQGT